MEISIVMGVYNGEKYILPQLDSIKNQTLSPTEVLIFDDCSTDNSFNLISEYIIENNLKNWVIKKNPANYGWKKNFAKGLQVSKGEYIFTADQDDIWSIDKVEIMVNIMEANINVNLLVGDYIAFKYNDLPNMNIKVETSKLTEIKFNKKFYYIKRPGCTFCIRKKLIKHIDDIWYEDYAHDVLLWHLAIVNDSLYHINYNAILFRRHDENATPSNEYNSNTRLKNAIIALEESIQILDYIKVSEVENKNEKVSVVNEYIEFQKNRVKFFRSNNMFLWLSLFRYIKNYMTFKSWFIDLLCFFR